MHSRPPYDELPCVVKMNARLDNTIEEMGELMQLRQKNPQQFGVKHQQRLDLLLRESERLERALALESAMYKGLLIQEPEQGLGS